MLTKKIFAFVITLVFLFGCRTNKEEITLKGNEYYPLKPQTITYRVDSIFYNGFLNKIDTVSFDMREETKEKLEYLNGDSFYRIELSRYNQTLNRWVVFSVFSRNLKDNFAFETSQNNKQTKLLLPISTYKTKGNSYAWNTNMFNTEEPMILKYTSVFKPYDNGIKQFNDCVVIEMTKPERGILNRIYKEVYAKDIGLVYRYLDFTDSLDGSQKLTGFQVTLKLK